MPSNQVQKVIESLDTLHEVRMVNNLIQVLCGNTQANDLGVGEANGLLVLMQWQNEKLLGAEAGIKTVLINHAALVKAA